MVRFRRETEDFGSAIRGTAKAVRSGSFKIMVRKAILGLLQLYQKVFTLLSYGSCRYYPTCSEYAKWRFEKDNLFMAFVFSIARVLRCNQLFAGGIDYPVVRKRIKDAPFKKIDVHYWLVPKDNNSFYLIKSFKG